MAPTPPAFGPPRRSRGGPLLRGRFGGPEMASTPPSVRTAPAKPVAVPYPASGLGPPNGPPPRAGGPGGAGMVLYDRVESFWGPDMAPLRSERPGGTGAVLDHRGSRFHRFKTNGDASSVMKACGIGSPSMPISRASTLAGTVWVLSSRSQIGSITPSFELPCLASAE